MLITNTKAGTFYAHSFDAQGERWCVLDGNGHIVTEAGDDLTYAQAHRLAEEMNEDTRIEALDADARARLEAIANNPSLDAAE